MTKNEPGDFNCYAKAEGDEEMFVLLGRDACAADAVRFWCAQRITRGLNKWNDAQIVEALACADRMGSYRKKRVSERMPVVESP